MKTMLIAVSAAALISAAPAVLAKPVAGGNLHHHVSKPYHRAVSHYAPLPQMQPYRPAFGYAVGQPRNLNGDLEASRQAGGGGGGGGGGGM